MIDAIVLEIAKIMIVVLIHWPKLESQFYNDLDFVACTIKSYHAYHRKQLTLCTL